MNPLEAIGDAMRNEQESNNYSFLNPKPIVNDSGDDAVSSLAKQLNLKLDDEYNDIMLFNLNVNNDAEE